VGVLCDDKIWPLVLLTGKVNADKYITAIQENLLPWIQESPERANIVLQQDKAPCSKANITS